MFSQLSTTTATTASTILLSTLTFLSLLTTQATSSALVGRTPPGPGVYTCNGADWGPPCTWTAAGGACHNVGQTPPRAFGPDQGISCWIYEYYNCNSEESNGPGPLAGPFVYPGTGDIMHNNVVELVGLAYVGSWQCYT